MKTVSYEIEMAYNYDPARKGAKYTMDNGRTYKNTGEWIESIIKYHRGYDYLVNPATSYDKGSDIEQMNASVKSSGASLASVYGDTVEEILNEYFEKVHSSLWIFGVVTDSTMTEYHMNAIEFREFCNEWGVLAKESGSEKIKIRFKKVSTKMLRWFEERVEN